MPLNVFCVHSPVAFLSPVPSLPIPPSASSSCLNAISCQRITVNITAIRNETSITTGLALGAINLLRIGDSVPGKKNGLSPLALSTNGLSPFVLRTDGLRICKDP